MTSALASRDHMAKEVERAATTLVLPEKVAVVMKENSFEKDRTHFIHRMHKYPNGTSVGLYPTFPGQSDYSLNSYFLS